MKAKTINKLTTAGLLLASFAALRGKVFRAPRPRHHDPARLAAAEVKRMFRQQRNLWIQSRGGYGPTPFARGQELQ